MLFDLLVFLGLAALGFWVYRVVARSYEEFQAVEAAKPRAEIAQSELERLLPEIAAKVGGRVVDASPEHGCIYVYRRPFALDARCSLAQPGGHYQLQIDVTVKSEDSVPLYSHWYPWESGLLMFRAVEDIVETGHVLISQRVHSLLPAHAEAQAIPANRYDGWGASFGSLASRLSGDVTVGRKQIELAWRFPVVSVPPSADAIEASLRLVAMIHKDAEVAEYNRAASLLALQQTTRDVGLCLSATLTLLCYFAKRPECQHFARAWELRFEALWASHNEALPHSARLFGEPSGSRHHRQRCIALWLLVFLVHWAEFDLSGVQTIEANSPSDEAPKPEGSSAGGDVFARYCLALGKSRGTPPQLVLLDWPDAPEQPMPWLLRNFAAAWSHLPKDHLLPLWEACCERFAYGAISSHAHARPPSGSLQRSQNKLLLHPLHEIMWQAYGQRLPAEVLNDGLSAWISGDSREQILEGLGALALLYPAQKQSLFLNELVLWEMSAQDEGPEPALDPMASPRQPDNCKYTAFRVLLDVMEECAHPALEGLLLAMVEHCHNKPVEMEPFIERLGVSGGLRAMRALYQLSRRRLPASTAQSLQDAMEKIEGRLDLDDAGALSVIEAENDEAGALSLDDPEDGKVSLIDDPEGPS